MTILLIACFALAAFTYSVCGVLLARGWRGRGAGILLLAVVAATVLWALTGLVAAGASDLSSGTLESPTVYEPQSGSGCSSGS